MAGGDVRPQSEMAIQYARFHPLPDGSLGVVYSGLWGDVAKSESGMFLSRISDTGQFSGRDKLSVERPIMGRFFTNSPRSGSDVGNRLDIVGSIYKDGVFEMRYIGFEVE